MAFKPYLELGESEPKAKVGEDKGKPAQFPSAREAIQPCLKRIRSECVWGGRNGTIWPPKNAVNAQKLVRTGRPPKILDPMQYVARRGPR